MSNVLSQFERTTRMLGVSVGLCLLYPQLAEVRAV